MLEKILKSGAEVAVLGVVLFYDSLHLREIARRAGISPPEAKHELDKLVSVGVLLKTSKGNLSIYTVNSTCSFLGELKGLYLKTEGAIPLLKNELEKMPASLRYAFVYGSFANGDFKEGSDIDLLAIGNAGADEVNKACFDVQRNTGREVNYVLWSDVDFKKKIREGSAFFSSVVRGKKIWLVGDANEFKRVVEKAGNSKNRA